MPLSYGRWKDFKSLLYREENDPFVFGRGDTHKIPRRDNPSIKVTLFWSCYESKKVTRTGHYAWTSGRTQEAGKTTDALAGKSQGSYRPTIGSFKRNSTRQGKNGIRWWKKKLGIGNAQMRNEVRRKQWQTTPEQLILPRKSPVGSSGV